MTTEQWVALADAFHKWPFKPDVLEDETYVEEELMEDFRSTGVRTKPIDLKDLDGDGNIDEDEMDINVNEPLEEETKKF
jgi:hypothetical protein